jgi:hypothetical protein
LSGVCPPKLDDHPDKLALLVLDAATISSTSSTVSGSK